jgi:hypothetical protein
MRIWKEKRLEKGNQVAGDHWGFVIGSIDRDHATKGTHCPIIWLCIDIPAKKLASLVGFPSWDVMIMPLRLDKIPEPWDGS